MRKDILETVIPLISKFNNDEQFKNLCKGQRLATDDFLNDKTYWYKKMRDHLMPILEKISDKLGDAALDEDE